MCIRDSRQAADQHFLVAGIGVVVHRGLDHRIDHHGLCGHRLLKHCLLYTSRAAACFLRSVRFMFFTSCRFAFAVGEQQPEQQHQQQGQGHDGSCDDRFDLDGIGCYTDVLELVRRFDAASPHLSLIHILQGQSAPPDELWCLR